MQMQAFIFSAMKKLFLNFFLLLFFSVGASAQEYFTINQFDVNVQVNKDASLDITEKIIVDFTTSRHGIFREIPYEYKVQRLPKGEEKADMDMTSNGIRKTMIENIKVDGWNYDVSTEGSYYKLKIGDKDKYVDGRQEYVIHYTVLNAINFFKDKSELYWNLIGDRWPTTIKKVNFTITLPDALSAVPNYFIATGYTGSQQNNSTSQWQGNKIFSGTTTEELGVHECVTVGIVFPKDYLTKPNYFLRNIKWLGVPAVVFVIMFLVWRRWGKDEKLTITTEFYPPKNTSPSVAGYVIDDKLDRRDLTALVPYWGGEGYLKVKEVEKSTLLGFSKSKDYEFIKVKDLPDTALTFEKTLFNGIFASGDNVLLSSLKNVLYTSMNSAKKQLEEEVDRGAYYTKGSRGLGGCLVVLGLAIAGYFGYRLIKYWGFGIWINLSIVLSGIIIIIFAAYMAKKTQKGNELYQKLAGFKEFIQKVEKDKLGMLLKEDEHYFDKVLPFAIVFDVADAWKDKLKDLDVPPPDWYAGNYNGFTTYMFLNSLDHSMNKMTENFYSAPSSSGSSGGSWSGGGGGFSGGGFGGGGGGSW